MNEQKPLFSKKLIILLSVGGVLVAAVLAYFFLIRVQDSEYDAASQNIDLMIAKAAEFEELASDGLLNPGTLDAVQLANAKQITAAYNGALTDFKKSRAFTADANVANRYNEKSELIEQYGKSSADMVLTIEAVASLQQSCDVIINNDRLVKSLKDLFAKDDNCLGALEQYKSVPLADYDKNYYQVFHEQIRTVLTALEVYYTASEKKLSDSEQQKALNSYVLALYAIKTLENDEKNVISNSANPTDELKKLQDILKQQRGALLR